MRIKKLATGKYQVRWRDKQKVQRARNFRTKEMAQEFLRDLDKDKVEIDDGTTVADMIAAYQASPAWQLLDYPTQILYQRIFARWFDLLSETLIRDLTPKRVSAWISDMKVHINRFGKANKRQSFRKELYVLKSLVSWYQGYADDERFTSPIRKRHDDEAWLEASHISAAVNFEAQVSDEIPLTEAEFERFRAEIGRGKFGKIMMTLADVQFDHSLRISEAAALMWSDVRWEEKTIKFQRHVQYVHQAQSKHPDRIVPGLKNKKMVKRQGKRFERRAALSKTNPFFPRSTRGLKELWLGADDKAGLVFRNPETGTFFAYRAIQNQYDRAFKRAGLSYTGTHIVRYGGVNDFMEKYDADDRTGMELLGNNSEGRYILRRSTKVHDAVKRKEPSALEVHSTQSDSRNFAETRGLEKSGGTDGFYPLILRSSTKSAL